MYKVDNAIIMAAGMSSRFVPLSYEVHKGLLPVKGEILIERQIRQLHEAGITDITVVTGYRKEDFRYLKDEFGVDIVENDDYYRYNNPSSLLRWWTDFGTRTSARATTTLPKMSLNLRSRRRIMPHRSYAASQTNGASSPMRRDALPVSTMRRRTCGA